MQDTKRPANATAPLNISSFNVAEAGMFGDESDELRRAIFKLLNQSKRMVLNLASIAYLDSSGLDTLAPSFIFAVSQSRKIKVAAL